MPYLAQKTFREKKLDHLKRLSDEAAEAEGYVRVAIGLLYVFVSLDAPNMLTIKGFAGSVIAENNHLAELAGVQREPVTVASLCANTPLAAVLARYTQEIEAAQADGDQDPGGQAISPRQSEEDAETISERSEVPASRRISQQRRRHSTISEPVLETEEEIERICQFPKISECKGFDADQ